jgi:DnaJ family protein C protein 28
MEENRKKKPGQSWSDFVEQQIRDAMDRGEFDNLPGKGRPQNLSPYSGDPSLEMANKIVRDAGFVPAWLELEQEIDREQREADEAVVRSWRWRETVRGDAIEDPRWVDEQWSKARALFEKRVAALNSKILNFNLQLPPPLLHRQRPRLRLDAEYARLGIDNS